MGLYYVIYLLQVYLCVVVSLMPVCRVILDQHNLSGLLGYLRLDLQGLDAWGWGRILLLNLSYFAIFAPISKTASLFRLALATTLAAT